MDESSVARKGVPAGYVQDASRRFGLSAGELRFAGGFESRDGRLEESRRFMAEASVTDGALRRAGLSGEASRLGLTLRPLAQANEPPRLLLLIGYRGEGEAAVPFAEAFLPPSVFEALAADLRAGLAQELSLSATTSLWIREEDRERRAGEPLDWYLGLDADGRTALPARGFIETIAWRPSPPPAVPEEHEDWHESNAEELRRINGSFRLFLVLVAFLLIIVAMK